VRQLTVEKPATVAVCEELSKWQSENVIQYDDEFACTRTGAEFPAIALSETLTTALTKKRPRKLAARRSAMFERTEMQRIIAVATPHIAMQFDPLFERISQN
jgi:hypothetical protein